MKYLLLIPATLAILFSAFFWVSAIRFKWEGRWTVPLLCVAGFCFQFTAVYLGSLLDG